VLGGDRSSTIHFDTYLRSVGIRRSHSSAGICVNWIAGSRLYTDSGSSPLNPFATSSCRVMSQDWLAALQCTGSSSRSRSSSVRMASPSCAVFGQIHIERGAFRCHRVVSSISIVISVFHRSGPGATSGCPPITLRPAQLGDLRRRVPQLVHDRYRVFANRGGGEKTNRRRRLAQLRSRGSHRGHAPVDTGILERLQIATGVDMRVIQHLRRRQQRDLRESSRPANSAKASAVVRCAAPGSGALAQHLAMRGSRHIVLEPGNR